jgi:hypothetical protein
MRNKYKMPLGSKLIHAVLTCYRRFLSWFKIILWTKILSVTALGSVGIVEAADSFVVTLDWFGNKKMNYLSIFYSF